MIQNVAFDQRNLVGGRHHWIKTPRRTCTSARRRSNIVWHQVFWNDELEHVYSLGGLPEARLPLATVAHAGRGGRLISRTDGRSRIATPLPPRPWSSRAR